MNFNTYYFLDTRSNLQKLSLPNLEPGQGLFVEAGVGADTHHARTVWFKLVSKLMRLSVQAHTCSSH